MKKILLKTASVLIIQVFYQLSTFVNRLLLTRLLSVSDFGTLSIILLWSNFLAQLIGFGTGKLVTKEISKSHNTADNHEIQSVVKWSLVVIITLTFILSILFIIKSWIFKLDSISPDYLFFLMVVAFSFAVYEWYFSVYNGFNKVVHGRLIQFIAVPVSLLIFLIYCHTQAYFHLTYIIYGYSVVYAVGSVLAIIVSLKISKSLIGPWRLSRKKIDSWLSFSSMNFLTIFLLTIFLKLDLIFVNLFLSTEDFALYAIAVGILNILNFVNTAFVLSLESKISFFHSKGQLYRLIPFLRRNIMMQLLLVIPIYLVVLLAGEQVLALFGEEYAKMSPVLNILCLVLIVQALTGSSGILLTISGNLKEKALATIIPGLIAIFFYPLLIYLFGLVGIAVGYAIIISLHRVAMTLYVNKKFGFKFFYLD